VYVGTRIRARIPNRYIYIYIYTCIEILTAKMKCKHFCVSHHNVPVYENTTFSEHYYLDLIHIYTYILLHLNISYYYFNHLFLFFKSFPCFENQKKKKKNGLCNH
jgi:hypothetical protein